MHEQKQLTTENCLSNANNGSPATTVGPSSSSSSSRGRPLAVRVGGGSLSSNQHYPTIPISRSDQDATLALLETIDWDMARNTSRRNVIRRDDPATPRNDRNRPYCNSFVFGRNMKDPAGGLSFWSARYPKVYAGLRDLMARYDPDFDYTHITLNKNLRCKRHTDGGNAGPSYIAGFGDYTGGELLVEMHGGGMPETMLDLRGIFVMFDGKNQPHETQVFEGERYTLVYYTSDIVPGEGSSSSFVDRSNWEYRGGRAGELGFTR
ncbi:hypothetical protein ACHAW5_009798 [Stephanodiscus triporus]|uniref:Fe2OG dioxygenase domain-containing protein n=1 Tax=Stephanodiscus triporus TaxID=2934178 RepID=A0ABD3NY52_9STRA